MPTRKTTLFYIVLIAVASAAVGMVISSQWGLPAASSAQTVSVPPANSAPLSGPIDATTFRNIAKSQAPVVVNIRTSARVRREMTDATDEMFRRFFGQSPRGRGRTTPEEPPIQQGAGTGFVWDSAGHVVTNNHVVEGARKVFVQLDAGDPIPATVVGRAPEYDLAVVRLSRPPKNLRPIPMGSSSDSQIDASARPVATS